MVVLQLKAKDFDQDDNAVITYSPAGQVPQLGGQDLFTVATNGAITTTTAAAQIRWPANDTFSFIVRAQDHPNPPEIYLES